MLWICWPLLKSCCSISFFLPTASSGWKILKMLKNIETCWKILKFTEKLLQHFSFSLFLPIASSGCARQVGENSSRGSRDTIANFPSAPLLSNNITFSSPVLNNHMKNWDNCEILFLLSFVSRSQYLFPQIFLSLKRWASWDFEVWNIIFCIQ